MKPLTINKIKTIANAAHALDTAIIDIFSEEPLKVVAWVENKGLVSIPESIFLRPWMEQERESLNLIWRTRNELFQLLQELDDRPLAGCKDDAVEAQKEVHTHATLTN